MSKSIPCGKYDVEHAKLTGSSFVDVCLGDTVFDNVSLANARLNNVNMAGTRLNNINMTGARLSDINLANVEITDAHFEGMKIDGVAVTDMLAAYHKQVSEEQAGGDP